MSARTSDPKQHGENFCRNSFPPLHHKSTMSWWRGSCLRPVSASCAMADHGEMAWGPTALAQSCLAKTFPHWRTHMTCTQKHAILPSKKNFYSQRMLNVDGKASASERHYMSGGTLRLSWDTVGWQGLGHNWDTGHCNKLTTEISHGFSEEFHNIIWGPQWGNNNCKRN